MKLLKVLHLITMVDQNIIGLVLMLNQYYDRYYDWPMTQRNLQAYVISKYTNPDGIHHYEISQKSGNTNTKIKVELADEPSATSVTNYGYESRIK